MMNLVPDEELTEVGDLARSIGAELLAPAARDAERAGAVPDDVWRKLFETGLAVPVPEEHGGGGVPDPMTMLTVVENLAHGDPAIALAAYWNGAGALLLAEHGSTEQHQHLAALATQPERRTAVALHEGFGRGAAELATTVQVDGDHLRLVGTKRAVPFASDAELVLVVATDPDAGALRVVVVPAGAAGVTVVPDSGRLALDAVRAADVDFDVELPASALLGGAEAPADVEVLVQRLRLWAAAAALGTAQRAIEYAAEYATGRIAFGQPIGAFQGVSFPLAEASMRIEAARLELVGAVLALDERPATEHDDLVSLAASYAYGVGTQSTRDAVQTLGGHGFIKDHPVELWYRSAAAMAALDTDPARAPFSARL
ncbi:MAG: hypothetical protein CMH83_04745 [Nocardioides sp.]|nr:hypothetical protein [Nocardioides sp.]